MAGVKRYEMGTGVKGFVIEKAERRRRRRRRMDGEH